MTATTHRRRGADGAEHRLRFGGVKALARRHLRRPRARGAGDHRPERRRQELDAQLSSTASTSRRRASISLRGKTFRHMNSHEVARDGHRADLPESGAVQGHERARQHHDRAQPEDDVQHLRAGDPLGAAEREETAHRESSSSGSSTSSRSSRTARRRSASCPTACRSGSTSAARWRWNRRCCCSTSRWRA